MGENIYKFIFYLLFFVSFESNGQLMFIDNFENGQFGNWENSTQWTICNQSPVSGKYSVCHAVTGIRSASFINRKIPLTGFNDGLVTWSFKFKNGNWIFGATEQFCFYLVADRADIPTANGYAIGVNLSGGDNVLKLCRMADGKAVQEIVITDLIWRAGLLLEVEVSHEYGIWKVRYKEDSTDSWSQSKTGIEKLLNFSYSNIGISYKFNTSHGGQLWIDDVSMDYVNHPPVIHEVRSIGSNRLLLLFSEPISQVSLLKADNYKIHTSGGKLVDLLSAQKASGDTAGVYLQIGKFEQLDLHLTIENLIDLEGLAMSAADISFTFIPVAQFGDVVLNEIMTDPTPVVKLPNAEYIELKNTSGFSVNLKNWMLEINGKQKVLSDKPIAPGGFLILGGTGINTILGSYGTCLEISGFALANEGVAVKLYSDASLLIDSFDYKPTMHRKGFSDGGYSLERIDPARKCGNDLNWETSISDKGGTPGIENSVFRSNPDLFPPAILSVVATNPGQLEVVVSEMPNKQSITGNIFSFLPLLPAPDSVKFDRINLKYYIYFPDGAIKSDLIYQLEVDGLADDCGNKSPAGQFEFWYYIPKQGDLLISEVLFNPLPGGVDFVEIFNQSGRKIKLGEVYLGSRDHDLKIKSIYPLSVNSELLLAEQYAAFTSDSAILLSNYHSACPGCIFEMEKFPAYNIDEGWVVLLNKKMEIIDEFHYLESMHHPMISDVKGISLERNSFSKTTNDPFNWHSASATVGFATPGYQNSAVDIVSKPAELVTIEPKIFSPNDDGINDRLLIKLSPAEAGVVANIRIYNENGLEIRRLSNNLLIGTHDVVEWDGTTGNHAKASLGIYIIQVELFGLQSGMKQFKFACVLTDRLE